MVPRGANTHMNSFDIVTASSLQTKSTHFHVNDSAHCRRQLGLGLIHWYVQSERASEGGAAQTNGVVDCHTIKVMLRLGHAPVEAGVSDGIFRMVSRNRFQAEATELAVV